MLRKEIINVIVIYIFEIPIIAIVMLMLLLGGLNVGEACRFAGSFWAVGGAIMSLWFLLGGYPIIQTTKDDKAWGIRIFLIAAMVLLFVIPGWNVYQYGVGLGDNKLIELIFG